MINHSLKVWCYRLGFLLVFAGACANGVTDAASSQAAKRLGAAVPQAVVETQSIASAKDVMVSRLGHL